MKVVPVTIGALAPTKDTLASLIWRDPARPDACIEEVRFASDSPLEGDGFEPSVPGEKPWVQSGKHFADSCRQAIRLSYSRTLRGC